MSKSIKALALALALTAGAAQAQESYIGYDAFPGTEIDFTKWLFGERTRVISGGVLTLAARDYGDQTSDNSVRRSNMNMAFDEPARVTQMRANVAMNSYDLAGCASNSTFLTRAQARVVGAFFNTGTPTPGSQLNDVIAVARLTRSHNSTDPAGVVKVEAFLVRCTTSDCLSSEQLGSADFGTTTLGTFVRLTVEWDQPNKRFTFQRDSLTPVVVPYSVSDSNVPGNLFKQLDARVETASCLSGPRTTASVSTKFDAVQVNASALP